MKKLFDKINDNKLLFVFSFLESFLQVYGTILSCDGSLSDLNLFMLFTIIAFGIILFCINIYYFKILSFKYNHNYVYNFSKKRFFITWIMIFIMWIPVLLAYYPTIWTYDVFRQVPHLIGEQISSHQPILHTLFIETFLIIGKNISSYELGMLLLSIIQIFLMSLIFAYSIEKMKTKINNRLIINIFTIMMIVYYCLMPFNSIMAISMTKDVLFSGLLLLMIVFLFDFMDKEKYDLKDEILFVIVATLMLLIKNNALYVFLVFSLLTFIFLKRKRKKMFFLCMCTLILYFSVNLGFFLTLHPDKTYRFEQYSHQTQNLIYIVIKHPEEDVKNNELLFDFIHRNCFSNDLSLNFNKNRSDDVKDTFIYCLNNDFDDLKLLKIWLDYGMKYPIDYIDSSSNLTIGSWYLFDESHSNTYGDSLHLKGYLASNYLSVEGLEMNKPESKFPWLYNKLELVATDNIQYDSNILFRFLFTPATYVLSFILMFIYAIKYKMKEVIIPMFLLLALYSSIIIGPVIIVRYIYPFMVTIPFIFVRIVSVNNKKRIQ